MSKWVFRCLTENTSQAVIAMKYLYAHDRYTQKPPEIPPGEGTVEAEGNGYVTGWYEIKIQGEIFLITFNFLPGQAAGCTANRLNPGPSPKFGVEVVNVESAGHTGTAQIQVFPR